MDIGSSSDKKRYDNIDALRGIAAVMVMILHIYNTFITQDTIKQGSIGMPTNPFEYMDIGRVGITIFFLISGFVIGRSITSYSINPIKTFVIRRFFRLYPLFWFSIILAVVFIWYPLDRSYDYWTILANITMVPAFFQEPFFIGLYWSLETELIFYVLVLLIFLFTRSLQVELNILLTIALFGLAFLFTLLPLIRPTVPHWMATPYHLGLMLLGMTWRECYEDRQSGLIVRFRLHLLLILSVPIAFIAYYIATGIDLNLSDSIAYLSGIFIFFIGLKFWITPSKGFTYLGKISYSVYLLHPLIFHLFLRAYRSGIVLSHHVLVYVSICSVATILLAHITYNFIERPAFRLGRRLSL